MTNLSGLDEFKLRNNKNGNTCKRKVGNHIISRVPALHALFQWPEREETEITKEKLIEAVSDGLSSVDQDCNYTCYLATLNITIWGFLSAFVSGEADTTFQAQRLQGVDAWRRLVRLIDHGRNFRT